MDWQDLQDDRRSDLQFGEITEKIIVCAFAPEHQAQTIKASGRSWYTVAWAPGPSFARPRGPCYW